MSTVKPIRNWQVMVAAFAMLLISTQAVAGPIPVTTKKLSELLFFPVRDAPATAISLNDTRVSSELSGILEKINARVGESVKKGDVIATVDCGDYKIAVKQAEAAYKSAKAKSKFEKSQLEKARSLSKTKSISSEELDRRASNSAMSSAEVERMKAALEAAERSVKKCAIHAPFDAVVIERVASLGDYLVPGTPILRLLDRENIEISAKVQEQDLQSLKDANELVFVAQGRNHPLHIRTVLPLIESRIRSYEVRLTFDFEDKKALVGTAGRLRWTVPVAHIPADLLVRRKELGIFIEKEGRAEFVPLDHAREGHPASVAIPGSTHVIVEGRFGVKNGDAVQVTNP